MTHSSDVLMLFITNLQVKSVGESTAAAAKHIVGSERLGESSACTRRILASTVVSCSSHRCPRADLDVKKSVETTAGHNTHHATLPLRASGSVAITTTAVHHGETASEMRIKGTVTEPEIKGVAADACPLLAAGALESGINTHARPGDAAAPLGSPRSIDADGLQARCGATKPVELCTHGLLSPLADATVDTQVKQGKQAAAEHHHRPMPACVGATDQRGVPVGSKEAGTGADPACNSAAVEALQGATGPFSGIEDSHNTLSRAIVAPADSGADSGAAYPQEADTRPSADGCQGNAASRTQSESECTDTSASNSRYRQDVAKAHDAVLWGSGEVCVCFDEPILAVPAQPLLKGTLKSGSHVHTSSPRVHTDCVPGTRLPVSGEGHADHDCSSSSHRPKAEANACEQRGQATDMEASECVKAKNTTSSIKEQSCGPGNHESPRIQAVAQAGAGLRSGSHSPVRITGALQMPMSPRGAVQLLA